MKKILALIMAMAMVFCMAACGSSQPAAPADPNAPAGESGQQTEVKDPEVVADTKTGQLAEMYASEDVYAEYEMEEDGEVIVLVVAKAGDSMYTEMKSGGETIIKTIVDGDSYYMIDDNEKVMLKMSADADGAQEGVADDMFNEDDLDMAGLTIGETEVEGTKYYSETWTDEDGDDVVYCFDGSALKYIVETIEGEPSIIKVLKMENKVPAGLFDIPADYEVYEF